MPIIISRNSDWMFCVIKAFLPPKNKLESQSSCFGRRYLVRNLVETVSNAILNTGGGNVENVRYEVVVSSWGWWKW